MGNKIMTLSFISILCALFLSFSNLYAQRNDLVEINLKKAGKLGSELKKVNNFANLKISGPLNGSDFVALKKYCSLSLKKLDLSNTQIIPGGKVLYKAEKQIYKVEKENVLCNYSLSDFKYLNVLKLPQNIEGIEELALANSPNISAIYLTNINPSNKLSSSIEGMALKCKKIIVPGDSYHKYKKILPRLYRTCLFKSDAPSEYKLFVSSYQRLSDELEGGFDFVKKLTVSGVLNDSDLKVIKQLNNLEFLDLSLATIKDTQLDKRLEEYVDKLVPKSKELQKIKTTYDIEEHRKQSYVNNLQNEIKSINEKKRDLEKRRENYQDEQAGLAFMSILFNLTESEIKKQHKRGEIDDLEYFMNSQFISEINKEIEKELKDFDLTDDKKYNKIQGYYTDLIVSINDSIYRSNTIAEYNRNLSNLKSQLDSLTAEYNMQKDQIRNNLKINSSIPENFLKNPRIKHLILPINTVVIAPNAFNGCPSDIKIEVDKEKIQVDGKNIKSPEEKSSNFNYDSYMKNKNNISMPNGEIRKSQKSKYFKNIYF